MVRNCDIHGGGFYSIERIETSDPITFRSLTGGRIDVDSKPFPAAQRFQYQAIPTAKVEYGIGRVYIRVELPGDNLSCKFPKLRLIREVSPSQFSAVVSYCDGGV